MEYLASAVNVVSSNSSVGRFKKIMICLLLSSTWTNELLHDK